MKQPYKQLLLAIIFVLTNIISKAQVHVTSSSGTTNASYTTLKGAFDAINKNFAR